MSAPTRLRPRYARTDARGAFPRVVAAPDLPANRLAPFWRPLIDLADSPLAALRLRLLRPVSAALADPDSARWPWFSRIGVFGLRTQVLRHAGLTGYLARTPADLDPQRRGPAWTVLVDAVARFGELDARRRTLVIAQLGQLSYYDIAVRLAAKWPTNDDRCRYEVARAHGMLPGHRGRAVALLHALVAGTRDPVLALACCFQGIGQVLRGHGDPTEALAFERHAEQLTGLPPTWSATLVRSRYARARAALRRAQGDAAGAARHLAEAQRVDAELRTAPLADEDALLADENRGYLVEFQLGCALDAQAPDPDTVRTCCRDLLALDPYSGQARMLVGDGHAALGDYERAAEWFAAAGELGTGTGAMAWYRAGQCHDRLGDRAAAANAMGRCLELDATAVEPRHYLTDLRRGTRAPAG